jgi:amidase
VSSDPLAQLDAWELAELVRRGDVTPAELVEAAIARIERVDSRLRARAASAACRS